MSNRKGKSPLVFLVVIALVAAAAVGYALITADTKTANTDNQTTHTSQANANAAADTSGWETYTYDSLYTLLHPADWITTENDDGYTYVSHTFGTDQTCSIRIYPEGLLGRGTSLTRGPSETLTIDGVSTEKSTWVNADSKVVQFTLELQKSAELIGIEGFIEPTVPNCDQLLTEIIETLTIVPIDTSEWKVHTTGGYTYLVPPDWTVQINERGNAALRRPDYDALVSLELGPEFTIEVVDMIPDLTEPYGPGDCIFNRRTLTIGPTEVTQQDEVCFATYTTTYFPNYDRYVRVRWVEVFANSTYQAILDSFLPFPGHRNTEPWVQTVNEEYGYSIQHPSYLSLHDTTDQHSTTYNGNLLHYGIVPGVEGDPFIIIEVVDASINDTTNLITSRKDDADVMWTPRTLRDLEGLYGKSQQDFEGKVFKHYFVFSHLDNTYVISMWSENVMEHAAFTLVAP